MASIRDLSRHLNLSIGTISRALNGKPGVNQETRTRVQAAARSLNYIPNHAARNLRVGRTGTVALVLPPHPELHFAQPFFYTLAGGCQEVFAAAGLDLVMAFANPGASQVDQLRRIAETRWADAVLLAGTQPHDDRIAFLCDVGFPFAALGRSGTGARHFPSLDLDFGTAADQACARLIGLGHRRIATIRTDEGLTYHRFFAAGCRRAFARAGVAQDPALRRSGEASEAGGYAVTAGLMDGAAPPSALVFVSTAMVPGAYRALRDRGLQPGRDVSIIVTNDSPLSDYLQPPLTGFRPDLRALGRRLAEILLTSMERPPRIMNEVVPMVFVARGTDMAAQKRAGAAQEPP